MRIVDLPSPNHDARPAPVDMLILHYTGMQTGAAAIQRLRDPDARVSSHWVVEEDGTVFRLVPEERRAWHAGVSYWAGRTVLNDVSVGIEIVNPGHDWGYRPFPEAQMAVVERLAVDIVARWRIPARRVLAHSDVAPDRKIDPGELFDWPRLARAGVGLWPEMPGPGAPGEAESGDLKAALAAFGYRTDDLSTTVRAFQRHFRPARVDGVADDETRSRLGALNRLAAGVT